MGTGRNRIYNLMSLVFIILSIAWVVFVISRLVAPA